MKDETITITKCNNGYIVSPSRPNGLERAEDWQVFTVEKEMIEHIKKWAKESGKAKG